MRKRKLIMLVLISGILGGLIGLSIAERYLKEKEELLKDQEEKQL